MEPTTEKYLREMFRRIGLEYSPDIVKRDKWYLEHSWTVDEEEEYRQWLVNELRMDFRYYSKRIAEYEAAFFIMNYGWTTKVEEP